MENIKKNDDSGPVAPAIGDVDKSAPEQAHDGPGKTEPTSAVLEPATATGSPEHRASTGAHAAQPDTGCVSHEPNIAAPPVQSEVAADISVGEAVALASTVPEQGETEVKSLVPAGGQNTGQGNSRMIIRTQKCFVSGCEYIEHRPRVALQDHCEQVHGHLCLIDVCLQDGVSFGSKAELDQHVNSFHLDKLEEGAIACGGCRVLVSGYDELKEHFWKCHVLGVYACSLCLRCTSTVRSFEAHQQGHMAPVESKLSTDASVGRGDVVSAEQAHASGSGGQAANGSNWAILLCEREPSRRRRSDTWPSYRAYSNEMAQTAAGWGARKGRYTLHNHVVQDPGYCCLLWGCFEKSVSFDTAEELDEHLDEFHNGQLKSGTFTCDYCKESLDSYSELYDNYFKIIEGLYGCSQCQRSLSTARQFAEKLKEHLAPSGSNPADNRDELWKNCEQLAATIAGNRVAVHGTRVKVLAPVAKTSADGTGTGAKVLAPAAEPPADGTGTGAKVLAPAAEPPADGVGTSAKVLAPAAEPPADGTGTGAKVLAPAAEPPADGAGTSAKVLASAEETQADGTGTCAKVLALAAEPPADGTGTSASEVSAVDEHDVPGDVCEQLIPLVCEDESPARNQPQEPKGWFEWFISFGH